MTVHNCDKYQNISIRLTFLFNSMEPNGTHKSPFLHTYCLGTSQGLAFNTVNIERQLIAGKKIIKVYHHHLKEGIKVISLSLWHVITNKAKPFLIINKAKLIVNFLSQFTTIRKFIESITYVFHS